MLANVSCFEVLGEEQSHIGHYKKKKKKEAIL